MPLTSRNLVCVISVLFLFLSCFGGGGGSKAKDDSEQNGSEAAFFPTSFAVASPLAPSSSPAALVQGGLFSRAFDAETDDINDILNGTSTASCAFDPSGFITESTNAACYGPEIRYQNHPDDSSGSPVVRELPVGDLGLWVEEETDGSGEACSAAQLNARMDGVASQMNNAFQTMASLVCVINNNSGLSLPSNSTTSLTAEMNTDIGSSALSFTSAEVTHSNASGRDEYTYSAEFTYDDGAGTTYGISVNLVHIAGCEEYAYSGLLSYAINDTVSFGNCPSSGASSPITRSGSLLYRKYNDEGMALDARTGVFCGHDADALGSDGQIDPSAKFDGTTNPDGWGDDFNRFIANFNPTTLVGQFAYLWQAGNLDNYSRIFNIFLQRDTDTDLLSGTAIFGFGEDISTSDGTVDGFICNWAGPNGAVESGANLSGTAAVESKVQLQEISELASSGVFSAGTSEITYAPVNGCDYAGGAGFVFDRDIDGDLSDEDPAAAVTNDLAGLSEVDDHGFLLPIAPDALDDSACTDERLFTVTGEYHDGEYWDAVLRFENAQDIDSETDGPSTPDGTVPVKSDPIGSGIVDPNGIQLNFVHTLYVWDDVLYLGSLFTNGDNFAGDGSGGPKMNNMNFEIGSVGVLENASTLDGPQTMARHVFDPSADGMTMTTTQIHQPHGIWIDEGRDILYIANSFSQKILVFDHPSTTAFDGNIAPDRVIEHPDLGSPIHVFVDETNDRLFVAAVNVRDTAGSGRVSALVKGSNAGGIGEPGTLGSCNPSPPALVIFNNASTADGVLQPDVRIVGDDTRLCDGNNQTTHNIWYDESSQKIFASHHTNEFLIYDASAIDLNPTAATDYNVTPERFLQIHDQTDDSDLPNWSIYGFYYLASKDRLYVAAGYSSCATTTSTCVPDAGTPDNAIKVYDGVGLSHFNGQVNPTRVIHWTNGDDYYSPQGTWVVEE